MKKKVKFLLGALRPFIDSHLEPILLVLLLLSSSHTPMSIHLMASRDGSSQSSSSSSASSSSTSPLRSPTAPRPTRSEYAHYAAMLRHLDARESGKLSRRLVGSKASPASQPSRLSAEGPKKRKWQTPIEELSTDWPLAPVDLPGLPATLENAIISFATSYSRAHRSIPSHTEGELAEGDTILPPSLVSSTMEFVNKILVGMAAMRPIDVAKKRRLMRKISWHGVLGAASVTMNAEDQGCVLPISTIQNK